jgi:MIP family channel proteins
MFDSLSVSPRKLVAEVVGTFALIFIGAGSIIVTGGTDLVGIAIAHGLAFALLIAALGHVSDTLFNPALTIGLWVTRQMDTINTIAYIIAQLVGAVLGALALMMLFPEVMREASRLGTPQLNPGVSFAQGVGFEVILTMFLMLALLGTVIDQRGSRIGGFGVGLVLTMGYLVAGPLTGAAMNPARAFGPALLSGEWANHLIYWIGPVVGAVLAALLYQYLFAAQGSLAVAEQSATDEASADEAQADEAPVDEVPADEAPVDEESEDEAPADEAPVEPEPVDESESEPEAESERQREPAPEPSGESDAAGDADA